MKNLVVKHINVISCIILFAFAFPSTLTLNNKEISTKLQIETNLEKKVVNVINVIKVLRFQVKKGCQGYQGYQGFAFFGEKGCQGYQGFAFFGHVFRVF